MMNKIFFLFFTQSPDECHPDNISWTETCFSCSLTDFQWEWRMWSWCCSACSSSLFLQLILSSLFYPRYCDWICHLLLPCRTCLRVSSESPDLNMNGKCWKKTIATLKYILGEKDNLELYLCPFFCGEFY